MPENCFSSILAKYAVLSQKDEGPLLSGTCPRVTGSVSLPLCFHPFSHVGSLTPLVHLLGTLQRRALC